MAPATRLSSSFFLFFLLPFIVRSVNFATENAIFAWHRDNESESRVSSILGTMNFICRIHLPTTHFTIRQEKRKTSQMTFHFHSIAVSNPSNLITSVFRQQCEWQMRFLLLNNPTNLWFFPLATLNDRINVFANCTIGSWDTYRKTIKCTSLTITSQSIDSFFYPLMNLLHNEVRIKHQSVIR